MADLLKLFLGISLMAFAMIVIVLLIRRVFSKKMHPAVMLLLWAMVLVRLCLPFTLMSPVKLVNLPQTTAIAHSEPAIVQEQPAAVKPVTDIKDPPQTNVQASNPNADQTADTGKTNAKPQIDFIKSIPWWSVLAAIWMAGGIATLLLFINKANRFRKKLGICHAVTDTGILETVARHKQGTGVKKPIAVLECDFVHAPAIFGFIKPSILIPSRFIKHMDRNSLDVILLHEMLHVRCRDILMNYVWLLAKALHWFNPLVWIAYKKYEDDVELCRDQQVARRLHGDGALLYSQSLLEAARFSKISTSSVPSLTTSLLETGGKLKGRISRLVKPQKRSKAAVTACALLSAVMLVTCFTTACQPTLKTVVMTNTSPQNAYKAPTNWKDTAQSESGDIKIEINADVIMPDVQAYPVLRVAPLDITQEQADQMIGVCMQGKPLYRPRYSDEYTKQELIDKIAATKKHIAEEVEPLKKSDPKLYESALAANNAAINQYEELLKIAPDVYVYKPADGKFVSTVPANADAKNYIITQQLSVAADLGKEKYAFLGIQKSADNRSNSVFFNNSENQAGANIVTFEINDNLPNQKITQQEALAKAKKFLADIGIDYLQPALMASKPYMLPPGKMDYSKPIDEALRYYEFVFTRAVDGVPTVYVNNGFFTFLNDPFHVHWTDEKAIVDVDDTGILSFQWSAPSKVIKTEDTNATLLPFGEIQKKLKQQLVVSGVWRDEGIVSRTIHINKITLGMAITPVEGSESEYRMVPVWDFFGYSEIRNKNNVENSLGHSYLTINAIDGSIVTRW